jgi:hypothetical protein
MECLLCTLGARPKKVGERGMLPKFEKNTLVPAHACELMDLGIHSSLKDRKSKWDGLNGLGERVCVRAYLSLRSLEESRQLFLTKAT